MAYFAVLDGDSVSNVIVADSKEIAEQVTGFSCVEYKIEDGVGIGSLYDEKTNTFSSPASKTTNSGDVNA
jgi:hypothetical protein